MLDAVAGEIHGTPRGSEVHAHPLAIDAAEPMFPARQVALVSLSIIAASVAALLLS